MQESDILLQKLFSVDSDFNKIREEVHNKLDLIVKNLDSLTISKINQIKQELKESQKTMYDLKSKGDKFAREYVKFINGSSEVFFPSNEVNKLEPHHAINIYDAFASNNYMYIKKNGNDLSKEQIDILQNQISLYKEMRENFNSIILLTEENERICADEIKEKDSELSNLIGRFIDISKNALNNKSSNVPSKISNNISSVSSNVANEFKYFTKCGTKLNSDAMFCINCGNKFSNVNASDNKILEVNNKSSVSNSNVHFHDESFHLHSNSHSDFCCPNCGSENVQSLPIIYQSGSSGTNSVTQTTNFIGVTQGNTMTDLARSVAPPQQKEVNDGAFTVCVIIAIISIFIGLIPLTVICAILAVIFYIPAQKATEYNEKQFPIEYDNWKNSFLCHRCGNIFRK